MQRKTIIPNYIIHKLHSICGGVLHLCNTVHLASSRKMLSSIQQTWKEWLIKYKMKVKESILPKLTRRGTDIWSHVGPTWCQHVGSTLIPRAKLYWPMWISDIGPTKSTSIDNIVPTWAKPIHVIWERTYLVVMLQQHIIGVFRRKDSYDLFYRFINFALFWKY